MGSRAKLRRIIKVWTPPTVTATPPRREIPPKNLVNRKEDLLWGSPAADDKDFINTIDAYRLAATVCGVPAESDEKIVQSVVGQHTAAVDEASSRASIRLVFNRVKGNVTFVVPKVGTSFAGAKAARAELRKIYGRIERQEIEPVLGS